MRHKKLAISSLSALALLSFGFSFTLNYQASHNIGLDSTTTKVENVLPSVHPHLRGTYEFNIASDDINQTLNLTKHHLYLQSGTGLSNRNKQTYEKHLRSQIPMRNKTKLSRLLNKQWLSYVHENRKSKNQTHLDLTIHKIINDKHKIILTGYTQTDVPKKIVLHTKGSHLILSSKYAGKSAYGLVKKMDFKPISKLQAKSILNQDRLSVTNIGLSD